MPSKIKRSGKTTWYEQVDLTSLKVWDNAILEIQPEISLFGSLKVLDVSVSLLMLKRLLLIALQLHKNKLTSIPDSVFDLVFLANLDLSYAMPLLFGSLLTVL